MYRHGLDLVLRVIADRPDCKCLVVSRYDEILQYAENRGAIAVNSPESIQGVSYTIKNGLRAAEEIKLHRLQRNRTIFDKTIQTAEADLTGQEKKEKISAQNMQNEIRSPLPKVQDEPDYVVFMTADQPYLSEKTLRKVLDSIPQMSDGQYKTASVYCRDTPGNPTIFSDSLIPELYALSGDTGGRKVIRRHRCLYIEVEDERELEDIDRTPIR